MNLLINCFQSIGGNHYNVIPVDIDPAKLEDVRAYEETVGGKLITVSEEKGKEILQAQADAIRFQVELSLIHSGQKIV